MSISYRFLLFAFLILSSGIVLANEKQEFGLDCKQWLPIDPQRPPGVGFIRGKGGKQYVDLSKKFWISLDRRPLAFVLMPTEILVLRPETVEVLPYTSKNPDRILELMAILSELAKKMSEESRWAFRLKNGETSLVGLLARNKSCKAVPHAKTIICRKNEPCSSIPRSKDADAKACAKEMGLLEPASIERLNSACSTISDGKIYESVLEAYGKAQLACQTKFPDFAPLIEMKKGCEQGQQILNSLK